MKKYYKFFIILLVISFITPQIALAAWWNPFSWGVWNNIFNVFHKPQTTITTPSNNPVIENTPAKADIKQESKDQAPSLASTCSPGWKCETWSLCRNSLQTRTCVDANSCGVLTNKPPVAQSCIVVCTPNWQCGNWGVCSNSVQTRTCTDLNACGNNTGEPTLSQSCSMPQTTTPLQNINTPTGKNYYYDSLSLMDSNIAIDASFKSWLQDTSNQFRTSVNTLAGIPGGGLTGNLRNATIDLANANISIISSLLTNDEQWISYWQNAKNALNNQPGQFVDQSTFNSLQSKQSPTTLENELASIKSKINADLSSVLSTISTLSR